MRSFLGATVFTLAIALSAAACSGGDDATGTTSGATSGSPASCESTGKHLCERACACGTGGKCKTGFVGATGATTILTWSNQADCEGAFAGSRCARGGPAGVDFAKCEADITAAACDSEVLVDPPSCEAKRDGG